MYSVKATYRENNCDSNSPIIGLVLDQPYDGYTVHQIKNLVHLARTGQLRVYSNHCGKNVEVIIYYSNYYERYIATTKRDGLECNNLLSLPIYYPRSTEGSVTTYSQCSL